MRRKRPPARLSSKGASAAALLAFDRPHHPERADETTASRRRTTTSGAKEIRQHVFHDSGEYRILIIQGDAIADRASIEDSATIGALPVNQLRYRIFIIHRIEEIVP